MEKNKFPEHLQEVKDFLKSLITKDTDPILATKLAEVDKKIDSLNQDHDKANQELASTKELLFGVIKNTGFKPTGDEAKGPEDITPSVDEVLTKKLAKIEEAKKGA